MTRNHDLGERLLEYGASIIRLVESLPRNIIGKRIGDQLLRSGTSVGANYEEAQAFFQTVLEFEPDDPIAVKYIDYLDDLVL